MHVEAQLTMHISAIFLFRCNPIENMFLLKMLNPNASLYCLIFKNLKIENFMRTFSDAVIETIYE